MVLTSKQQSDLDAAIHEYLLQKGYTEAATALGTCIGLPLGIPLSPPEAQAGPVRTGLLEKKWVSVVRLQKKVMELESTLKTSSSTRGGTSAVIGRCLPVEENEKILKGHRGSGVNAVAFHPEYTLLASAGEDGLVKLWDSESGEFERSLKSHTSGVQALAFNGGGTLLVSSSSDLTVKLWNGEMEWECCKVREAERPDTRILFTIGNLIILRLPHCFLALAIEALCASNEGQ